MGRMTCHGRTHVFIEDTWGGTPWCDCGQVRNPAYKRSLLDKLLRRPKQVA